MKEIVSNGLNLESTSILNSKPEENYSPSNLTPSPNLATKDFSYPLTNPSAPIRPPNVPTSKNSSDSSISTVSSEYSAASTNSNSSSNSSSDFETNSRNANPYSRLVTIRRSADEHDEAGLNSIGAWSASLDPTATRSPDADSQASSRSNSFTNPFFNSQYSNLKSPPSLSREITPKGETATLNNLPHSHLSSALSTTPEHSPDPEFSRNEIDSRSGPTPIANTQRSSRPGSSGAFSTSSSQSTTSSRHWVQDSDVNSIYSGSSGSRASSGQIFKVNGADGIEFLDPRPEPKGAKLEIDDSDGQQIVLHVVLPGFSLENITVALKRHGKVHIVADSYNEKMGGHFEKLIELGSDVSSAAPRAEFDGTTLKVYIQRRLSRKLSVNTVDSTNSTSPGSPTNSISSLSLNSIDDSVGDDGEPPVVTRTTGCLPAIQQKKHNLTGPEGAKAAAKAAREEAAKRAKEAAKDFPKSRRKLPFRKNASGENDVTSAQMYASDHSSGNCSDSSRTDSIEMPEKQISSLGIPNRSGTIKGRNSPSNSPTNPISTETSPSGEIPLSHLPTSPLEQTSQISASPARPKFRGANLTLRPADRSSFVEASLAAAQGKTFHGGHADEFDARSEGGVTPKVERQEISFSSFSR